MMSIAGLIILGIFITLLGFGIKFINRSWKDYNTYSVQQRNKRDGTVAKKHANKTKSADIETDRDMTISVGNARSKSVVEEYTNKTKSADIVDDIIETDRNKTVSVGNAQIINLTNFRHLDGPHVSVPQASKEEEKEWFDAAKQGNKSKLNTLHGNYPDIVNSRTEDKNDIALHLSAENGHLDCVQFLVTQGAKINIRNDDNDTALLLSAQNGHLNVVKYLLEEKKEKKAKITDMDQNGNTALHLSAQKGHVNVVRYLVQQGADINTFNTYGQTALTLAKTNKGIQAVIKDLNQILAKRSEETSQ